MHQEPDADGLADVRGQIHRLANPGLAVATLMENGLEDVAAAICDVSASCQSKSMESVVQSQCQKLSVALAGTGPNS